MTALSFLDDLPWARRHNVDLLEAQVLLCVLPYAVRGRSAVSVISIADRVPGQGAVQRRHCYLQESNEYSGTAGSHSLVTYY